MDIAGRPVRLAGAGALVDQVPLPVALADGLATWRDLVLPTIGSGRPDAEFGRLAALGHGDDLAARTARALTGSYRDWLTAADRRQRQRLAWAGLFERYDAALAPVMPTVAFAHDTERPLDERALDVDGVPVAHTIAAAWCCAIGAMQLPVVTLPAGPTAGGLPAGLQVIGPFLNDLRLLRVAELIDAAAGPGFTAPPASA